MNFVIYAVSILIGLIIEIFIPGAVTMVTLILVIYMILNMENK